LSEFEKLKVVTKYEFLKQYRRKRFYGGLALVVLAVVLTIGLYKGLDLPARVAARVVGVVDSPNLFATFVSSMDILAIICAVFFAGDAIASEFEHKTGYILFPNPVKRTTIVVGKYIACVVSTAIIIIIAYLILAGALLGFYQQVPGGILGSMAIALILACSVISMAFVFSSVLKGGMGATIATLLTYLVIFSAISGALSVAGYDPWFMPNRAGDAVTATYGITFGQAFGGTSRGGLMGGLASSSNSDPTLSFFVLLGYTVVFLLISIWLAKRKEMM
jgi:ABC-2 type transport system permease protein